MGLTAGEVWVFIFQLDSCTESVNVLKAKETEKYQHDSYEQQPQKLTTSQGENELGRLIYIT
jgi:hypothetical protein